MSALDTLATAIGVFVLLVALLMPYYQNSFDLEETIVQLRVAHEQNAAQLGTSSGSPRRAPRPTLP